MAQQCSQGLHTISQHECIYFLVSETGPLQNAYTCRSLDNVSLPKLCNKCNMSEEQLESHDSLSLETSTYFKVPFAITFIYILLKGLVDSNKVASSNTGQPSHAIWSHKFWRLLLVKLLRVIVLSSQITKVMWHFSRMRFFLINPYPNLTPRQL